MGTVFIILFTISEILLVVLTFTKFGEKAKWLKNKLIIRSAETALMLGIIILPVTHMKWRFIAAMIILVFRFAVAGISYLVKHKKISGMKNKVGTVVNCIVSTALISVSLIPAFVFTNYNGLDNSGEFGVLSSQAILVDESRTDTFENDGSYREVPVHFYYPDSDGEFPLIIFSHGAFGYYESNYSTYTELASNGYIVAALDHPHHSFFTEDTDGQTIIVNSDFITNALGLNDKTDDEIFNITKDWLKLRAEDENFVLDTFKSAKESNTLTKSWHTDNKNEIISVLAKTDMDKIGLMGHSLGGATSVEVGRERNDIDAVIALDGTMLGERISINNGKYEFNSEPYPIPVLDFTKESDYNELKQLKDKNGYAYVNEYVIDNAKTGKRVIFANTGHMDFTDLPLISPYIASMLGKGEVNSEEFVPMMNGIVLNWFDYYLKGEGTLDIRDRY